MKEGTRSSSFKFSDVLHSRNISQWYGDYLFDRSHGFLWVMKQVNTVHNHIILHPTSLPINRNLLDEHKFWEYFHLFACSQIILQTTVVRRTRPYCFALPLSIIVSCFGDSICQSTRMTNKRMFWQTKSAAVCSLCAWFATRTHINCCDFWSAV